MAHKQRTPHHTAAAAASASRSGHAKPLPSMVLHQPVAATRGVSCRGSSPLQLFGWPSCSTHPLKPLRAALLHALLAAPAGFKSFAIFTWNLCTRDAEGLMLFAFQVYDAKGRGVMGACEITRRSCEAGGRYRKQRMRWSGRVRLERV